jgi:hypothetical protein
MVGDSETFACYLCLRRCVHTMLFLLPVLFSAIRASSPKVKSGVSRHREKASEENDSSSEVSPLTGGSERARGQPHSSHATDGASRAQFGRQPLA